MKVHLRFDSSTNQHSRITVFLNGRNCGQLTASPDEIDRFYLIADHGCRALSLHRGDIEFVGSGSHRPDEPIPPLPRAEGDPCEDPDSETGLDFGGPYGEGNG